MSEARESANSEHPCRDNFYGLANAKNGGIPTRGELMDEIERLRAVYKILLDVHRSINNHPQYMEVVDALREYDSDAYDEWLRSL